MHDASIAKYVKLNKNDTTKKDHHFLNFYSADSILIITNCLIIRIIVAIRFSVNN